MDAIIGHENMDFDCLASMVAAHRLHTGAKIFLQPTAEGPVLEYLNLYREHFSFHRFKEFDENELETLIIVEANTRDRIGPYKGAVDNAEQILIYEHHSVEHMDIEPDKINIEETGALITSLIEKNREQEITFTDEESTLYLLALHQETGSFQFGSTTARDYDAGRYLMANGANLDVVQKFIHRPLSSEQIDLMNDLLDNSRSFLINEVPVTLATARRDKYIAEIALLAHKLQDTENAQFLVLIVEIGDRIQMVFRNRYQHLDVGQMASRFGGGGHARAASAAVRGEEFETVEKEVLDTLNEFLVARMTARDLMSSPVHSIRPDKTVEDAHELMLRLGHHGLPITNEENELIGIITRTDVDKAINHDLTHAPAKGFMSPEVVTISPDAGLDRLQTILTNEQIGRLPVVEDGRLIGIVTRTDVIQTLHQEGEKESFDSNTGGNKTIASSPNVSSALDEEFSKKWIERFKDWGVLADELEDTLYLVGGCVRDILLERNTSDVDFLLENDAIEFAEVLEDRSSADLYTHEKFQTASITFDDGETVDFATARSEYYTHPAALPEVDVEHASIAQDLQRRDFTINAMAILLSPDRFGELIDYYGGFRDLNNGVIRILYAMSFVDDPTRIFRAIRFSRRLDFDIESRTLRQLKSSLEDAPFEEVSGERLRYELELIFQEDDAWAILNQLHKFGVLLKIHVAIDFEPVTENWFMEARDLVEEYNPDNPALVYYCLLFHSLGDEELREVCERLNFPSDYTEALIMNNKFSTIKDDLKKAQNPSEIHKTCKTFEHEEIIIARIASENNSLEKKLRLYQEDLRHRSPLVDGDTLKDWGVSPGPLMGEILDKLFYYQLDNDVESIDEMKHYFEQSLNYDHRTELNN